MYTNNESPMLLAAIAKEWLPEQDDPTNGDDLLCELETAWWLDLLRAAEAAPRLYVLKQLYQVQPDSIVFVISDNPFKPIEMPDDTDDRRACIRVPSSDSALWSDAECYLAYDDLAKQWATIRIAVSDLVGLHRMKVHYDEFRRYLLLSNNKRRDVLFWHAPGTTPRLWIPPAPANSAGPRARSGMAVVRKFVREYMAEEQANGRAVVEEVMWAAAEEAGVHCTRKQIRQARGPATLGRPKKPRQNSPE